MIASFGDKATEDLYHGRPSRYVRRLPPQVLSVALRKLDLIEAASNPLDLGAPPGNRLELLRGDRQGYYSIRVNERWRIVFRWSGSDAREVQIVDYHGG